jgi:hypothetical protein
MRCIAALQTCLALVLAFVLAPFQHVHTGGADHDHSGIIHAHFYSVPGLQAEPGGPRIVDPDDDHAAAWSLDTFTLVMPVGLSPFALPRGRVVVLLPAEVYQPVQIVEERGHDPPSIDRSIPRAPPS